MVEYHFRSDTFIRYSSVWRCARIGRISTQDSRLPKRNGHFVPVFGTDNNSISTVFGKMKSVNYGCTDAIWSTGYDNFHIVPTYQPSNPVSALDSRISPRAGLIREPGADTGFSG